MRDERANELYLPLACTVVRNRKKEMLFVPLDIEIGLTSETLMDTGAHVSAVAQNEMDRLKQQAANSILRIDEPSNSQKQVRNAHLEKLLATATLKFDILDNIFAEHFVVMKNPIGPYIGSHFMRHNSVVIDTTHSLIHFPHLTMQVKTAASETSAKV